MKKEEIRIKINLLFSHADLMNVHVITLPQLREYIEILTQFKLIDYIEFNKR